MTDVIFSYELGRLKHMFPELNPRQVENGTEIDVPGGGDSVGTCIICGRGFVGVNTLEAWSKEMKSRKAFKKFIESAK